MDPSPLTRQSLPTLLPKIHTHYTLLFGPSATPPAAPSDITSSVWSEIFLLPPDRKTLAGLLNALGPADVLARQDFTQEVVYRAWGVLRAGVGGPHMVRALSRNVSPIPLPEERGSGSPGTESLSSSLSSPSPSQATVLNTLTTLSVLFTCLLSKKYSSSSDPLVILAPLDNIDEVITGLTGALEGLVRGGKANNVRAAAVEVLMALAVGSWGGTVGTYLIQRDLFPGVMKYIYDITSSSPQESLPPFLLISLLANYNKFEFRNPYTLRLTDFINETTISVIIRTIGATCQALRASYIAVQDDIPEGWSLAGTLSLLTRRKKELDDEAKKRLWAELPGGHAGVLLGTYDFAVVNKLFCSSLVTLGPASSDSPPGPTAKEAPFAAYLSFTSYLLQHAHLSARAAQYATLPLMTIRLLIEDPPICKRLCTSESLTTVRLCRQRPPHLPAVSTPRVLACHILDLCITALTHNLRKRLDVPFYNLALGIILRLLSHLSRTRTRLTYHYAELWAALITLIKFLTQYSAPLLTLPHISALAELAATILTLALSTGESFLPTPAAYDDLFYKLLAAAETLAAFRTAYSLPASSSVATLLSVTSHYQSLLSESSGPSGTLTPAAVSETIRKGYETLRIQARDGLDGWEKYREGDERGLLKRVGRTVVADLRGVLEAKNAAGKA